MSAPVNCVRCRSRLRPGTAKAAEHPGTRRDVGNGVCSTCRDRETRGLPVATKRSTTTFSLTTVTDVTPEERRLIVRQSHRLAERLNAPVEDALNYAAMLLGPVS